MDYWIKVKQRWNSMIGNYHDFEFIINGYQLKPQQLEAFKRLTGFLVLEPGRYWLDPETGDMGVDGNKFPIMNIFQQNNRQNQALNNPPASLSERRQLFNSADLTGIWGVY